MPGVNTTGKPNTSDIVLGRGAIHAAVINSTTGKPGGFRHLGNCTAFNLTMETETLEHQSSRTGVRSVDREVILSQKAGVSITLDENSYQNLALWLSGTSTAGETNPATGATFADYEISDNALEGYSYLLTDDNGDRMFDVSGTIVLKMDRASTDVTLVENVDYELDRTMGMVFLIPGGTNIVAAPGNDLTLDYTATGSEAVLDTVDLLTQASVTVFLRFIGINAANSDKKEVLDLHSVTLKADGEMQRIGDEFAAMTLTGSAERNELGYPASPVGRFYTHPNS